METSKWDLNLKHITNHISQLEKQYAITAKEEKKILTQKKVAIIHYQIALERLVKRIQKIHKRKDSLPPKLAAIIYWGGLLAEKAMNLYKKRGVYLGQSMWQHLLKVRLMGNSSGSSSLFDDDDLIRMATRYGNLKKIETGLSERLIKLKDEERWLRTRYEKLLAAQTNASAAKCMTSSSNMNFDEFTKAPAYRVLENYFNNLTTPVRMTTKDEKHLQILQKEIIAKTKKLLIVCNNAITTNVSRGSLTIDKQLLEKLITNLDEIDELHSQMEFATAQVTSKAPPPPNPVLLSKNEDKFKKSIHTKLKFRGEEERS